MSKQKFNNKKIIGSKGAISVIVALSVLTIILTIGLSASYVTSNELRISGDASDSTKAYYAAEAGMERAMYEFFKGNGGAGMDPTAARCGVSWETSDDIKYCLTISPAGYAAIDEITAIQSIGEYDSVRRSVEISF